jgi:uncharacterized membrane protein YhaH (DUF805 family)
MSWFLAVLKKYAVFSGRAQRAEYWYFFLFYLLIHIALVVVDRVTGSFNSEAGMGLFGGVFALAMLLPSLAVSVRRLHDTDRSGWWLLIAFVPLIGGIVLLIFAVQDGTPGDNRFGSNPKAAVA